MLKYLSLTLLLIFIISSKETLLAQQDIQSSLFMINPFLVNPAYSSVDNTLDFKLSTRNQWTGIEGAPTTHYFSVDSPIGKPKWSRTHPGDFHNWHGAGLQVINDRIGPYNNIRINGNYSYNIALVEGKDYGYEHKDGLRLALGTFIGWNRFSINSNRLSKSKSSSGDIIDNDAVDGDLSFEQLSQVSNENNFDFTFGGLLYYDNKYFLGASTTQILQNDIELTESASLVRHYFLTGQVRQPINEEFYIIPSFVIQYVTKAPISYNLNIRLDWQDKYFVGLGYRKRDALTALIGAEIKWGEKVKNFRVDKHRYIMHVYYSYDLTLSRLGARNAIGNSTGSHEFTVAFLIPPFFKERNAEDTW